MFVGLTNWRSRVISGSRGASRVSDAGIGGGDAERRRRRRRSRRFSGLEGKAVGVELKLRTGNGRQRLDVQGLSSLFNLFQQTRPVAKVYV